MALVIETGSIVAGAESYADVAYCDTYHSNRGNAAWSALVTADKEAALRKACAYLDGHYRPRWKGLRVNYVTQPLEWPRINVNIANTELNTLYAYGYNSFVPVDQIPQRIKDAQCELALRTLSGDLAADANGSVRREKLDVIETEYAPGKVPGEITYQAVDHLLSDYLKPTGSTELQRG